MRMRCEAGLRQTDNVKRDSNIGSVLPYESGSKVSTFNKSVDDRLREIEDFCNVCCRRPESRLTAKNGEITVCLNEEYEAIVLENEYFVVEIPTDEEAVHLLFRVYTRDGMCMNYDDVELVSYIRENIETIYGLYYMED